MIQNFASHRSKKKLKSVLIISYIVTVGFVGIVSYTYLNVLQVHQKDRIDLWLGKIQDQDGKDYNRNRALAAVGSGGFYRSEEHTSELQSRPHLVCRLLLEKKYFCICLMFSLHFK